MKGYRISSVIAVVLCMFVTGLIAQDAENWKPLFNGENFDGFTQLNGEADYKVENGEMVGISKMGTPNSFMVTNDHYGDFILEFEVRVDASLNSGVQIRSHSIPSYRDGRVHGVMERIQAITQHTVTSIL